MPHPFASVVLEEVGSTNTEALERAASGEAGPLWIVARRQTQGRGRSGRAWASEPGNLHASLLTRLSCPPTAVQQLSLVAGAAAFDAIRVAAGGDLPGLRLKWPNDVLIGTAKCAGILAESVSGARAITAVIGVGINLAWSPTDLGRAATHLNAHGVPTTADAMLPLLDEAMQHWLAVWLGGTGFARVREGWLERGGPAGEPIRFDTGNELIEGTFVDLDTDGALVLRDAHGTRRKLNFGDVTLTQESD